MEHATYVVSERRHLKNAPCTPINNFKVLSYFVVMYTVKGRRKQQPRCSTCRAAADATQVAALVEGVQKVFYDACTTLEQWHEDLRIREQKNNKLQLARGAVPDSVQQAFDEQKTKYAHTLIAVFWDKCIEASCA